MLEIFLISFTKEVVRELVVSYNTVAEFMEQDYCECEIDNMCRDTVIVFARGDNQYTKTYVCDIPLIEGRSVDNREDVAFMLRSHFKE